MNSPNNSNQQATFIAVGFGILLLLAVAGGFMMMRGMSVMMLLSGGIFVLIVVLAVVFFVVNQAQTKKGEQDLPDWMNDAQSQNMKPKNSADVDMYTLIDDLIADLTEDEARYLIRKLDERQRQQLTTNIEDLLEDRRKNRR